MTKSRFNEERIIYALPQADTVMPAADICRKLGVSEASACSCDVCTCACIEA